MEQEEQNPDVKVDVNAEISMNNDETAQNVTNLRDGPSQTLQNEMDPNQSFANNDAQNIIKTSELEQSAEEHKSPAFQQHPGGLDQAFQGNNSFFPRMDTMLTENEVMPGMPSQPLQNYAFNEPSDTNALFNFPQGFPADMGAGEDQFGYGDTMGQLDEPGPGGLGMMRESMPMMYEGMPQMMPHSDFASIPMSVPDSKLRPARLSMDELQKELSARGLAFSETDKVSNVARLVNYLVDREYGESDLSSNDEGEFPAATLSQPSKRLYSFLEVILINCDNQRKPLLDWLETWKKASHDVNSAEISELSENNLIKIRIFNKFAEPSGVVEQLNSVKIKCARYYCYSHGENWGGWEYYEDGFMQKQETYDAERPPPLFWKRLCWLENAEGDAAKLPPERLSAEQVSAMLGTDDAMACAECGHDEKGCRSVHGAFRAQFKNKDLSARYAALLQGET